MLFFVFGLPGAFARVCENVVVEMAGRGARRPALIHAETLEELAVGAIATGTAYAVVGSRRPGGRLRGGVVGEGRRFVLALDDPRHALADLVSEGLSLPDAVQQLASSCAALAALAEAPGALILRADEWPDLAGIAAVLAHHLAIPLDAAAAADIADSVEAAAACSRQDAAHWWHSLAPAEQDMALGALQPYLGGLDRDAALSITWGRDLFFVGDRPQERVSGPVDITGRARCLLVGPQIMLPAGPWSLSLTALFSREAAEHEFLAEIYADRVLASGTMRPPGEGRAELALDFAVAEALEHPVALRLSTQRAAFDGAILIVGATLTRPAAPRG